MFWCGKIMFEELEYQIKICLCEYEYFIVQ